MAASQVDPELLSQFSIDTTRMIFACRKSLMWESDVEQHKRDCIVVTEEGSESFHKHRVTLPKEPRDWIIKEFTNDSGSDES